MNPAKFFNGNFLTAWHGINFDSENQMFYNQKLIEFHRIKMDLTNLL
ncbi:hypothetical protein BGP_3593 [Beggiatoa sp. PS]|nr:hypothetical protein BGP_3593 [Beggiatoa sp. PS]